MKYSDLGNVSLVQKVLFVVCNYPGGSRLIYDLIYNSNSNNTRNKISSIRSTLNRLRSEGLVVNDEGVWSGTQKGKKTLRSKIEQLKKHSLLLDVEKSSKKQMIVTFDIPEKRRKYRDWLRGELIGFGFEQVQKSVWFGPALPKDFIEYLGEIKLDQHIRFFKAREEDLI